MEKIIEIKNLTIKYKDQNEELIDRVNLNISSNSMILIDARNGAGKSTFIKTLLGMELKNKIVSGEIKILNSKNVFEMNYSELISLRSKIAYLEQKDLYKDFDGVKVYDILKDSYLAFTGDKLSRNVKKDIINVFNEYANLFSIKINDNVKKLSGGQQRIVSIISSVCIRRNAKLFILDEPLNNLDMESVCKISNLINTIAKKNNDASFIIVSHFKVFPFIKQILKIENKKIFIEESIKKSCNCLGEYDDEGNYYV